MTNLEHARSEYAEKIRLLAGLRSEALVRAFARVPREAFVGPGPWKILVLPDVVSYRDTPDDDPRHLYDNVLVALDASRYLNNGEPVALARWLDALDLAAGERVLHLGCGVGYYTAIAAMAVAIAGRVLGMEVDPALAERARRNLLSYPNVAVVCGDGSDLSGEWFDAILVNAGATEVQPEWMERLRPGGRLLVPLTVGIPRMEVGLGEMLLVTRCASGYGARFVSPVAVFHCAGARTAAGEALLRLAYARGGAAEVRSLRAGEHAVASDCWLHGARFCLSRRSISSSN